MTTLHLDLETFSPVPIKHGTHRYAEQSEILLFAWALDDDKTQVVDEANGEQRPKILREALADPDVLVPCLIVIASRHLPCCGRRQHLTKGSLPHFVARNADFYPESDFPDHHSAEGLV